MIRNEEVSHAIIELGWGLSTLSAIVFSDKALLLAVDTVELGIIRVIAYRLVACRS